MLKENPVHNICLNFSNSDIVRSVGECQPDITKTDIWMVVLPL